MKAKDLIKILEKYPERDVKIHNGYINDWMDIEFSEDELVKMKTSYHLDLINLRNKSDDNILTKEDYIKLTKEDCNNSNYIYKPIFKYKSSFIDYVKTKRNYTFKPIFLIQGKPRGLCTTDRIGTVTY